MHFGQHTIFGSSVIKIPKDCDVVFISDHFVNDMQGGAELTSDALIMSSPLKVFKLHARDLTIDLLNEGHQKFWIFGNFASMNFEFIPTIVANMKYAIIEYDFKFCKYRSPEKHSSIEGKDCDCHTQMIGKIISAFYHGAKSLWWMSEKQLATYTKLFPFLDTNKNVVLSSVFDDVFFANIKLLRENQVKSKKWVVIGSTSWIKGANESEQWCKDNGKEYEILWNLPYEKILTCLSDAEGLCFLPKGADTCPRITIEAKLLGCKLHINENVQQANELWFSTDDILDTESYLYMCRQRFWNGIKHDMSYTPTISGYTTTYNCIIQGYPFKESICSMLGFCDEIVIVDGGSTDGTWETLENFASLHPHIKILKLQRDWSDSRFAIFDGQQKAEARSLCTKEICWQQDSDEIVHENDFKKIKNVAKDFPMTIELLSLPVIEYWGGTEKIRIDINPVKWRMSRNIPHITHGIPRQLRRYDDEGKLFACPGTDGCDYINKITFDVITNSTFYTNEIEMIRQSGVFNEDSKKHFEKWFNDFIDYVPSVHHYSWFDIDRKIKTYRDYWSKHWLSLYNISQVDTAENNMFFDKAWKDVTDEEIASLAAALSTKMGGWIFHKKIDFSKKTNYISPTISHPAIMNDWICNHKK